LKQLLFIFFIAISLYSQTIKDITNIVGIRENQLLGYGLLVGLPGSGDKSKFTMQSLQNLLRNSYIKLPTSSIKSKNIAAVMVTASLPPFARQGDKLKLKVSSIGDAKSIEGGQLLLTQLKGVDGKVYALAQGTVTANDKIKTTGYIYDGAIIENEVNYNLSNEHGVTLSLIQQSAQTAALVEDKINKAFKQPLAIASDTRTIKVRKPDGISMIQFISKVQNIQLTSNIKRKIIINIRKGIIVAGANIMINPVTISRDNFTIRIKQVGEKSKSKMGGKSIGDGAEIYSVDGKKDIVELDNTLLDSKQQPTISDLMRALKLMKIDIKDIIDTIKMLDKLNAIDATVEVVN